MKFPRRSLSASPGVWRVQLAFRSSVVGESARTPHDETLDFAASVGSRRALLPAFLAIFIAVAAACYALAHFIALPSTLRILMVTLTTAIGVSWGARCGPEFLSRVCGAARWPMALTLTLCALSLRWSDGFSELLSDEPNMQTAVLCGFITLLSVLLIGARSGGRLVPVAAPLIPALSLLGLLCLAAVDGTTQACFLLFSAAALYLLCYDRFLRRVAPDLCSGVWSVAPRAQNTARGDAAAWALQSVLVSSVWFALFLGGGALVFWPLQAFLPRVAAPRWNRGDGDDGARKLDYSGGANVMELRGGTHALSDRVLMRATPIRGLPTGTWRGRVYENYERSLWSERAAIKMGVAQPPSAPMQLVRPRPLGLLRATLPKLTGRSGDIERITELMVPLGGVSNVIYSSGLPLSYNLQSQDFDGKDPQRTSDLTRSQSPYIVRSFETQPNLRVLDQTRGFDPDATDSQISPELRESLLMNLQLPPEKSTQLVLKTIANQLRAGALPVDVPSHKARAISEYLRINYTYSLQAPAVPPTSDATAFFLTDARSGACDMFASSMALLLREMGVPARVVTGFLDPRTPESMIENTENGVITKVLRERDAHAWVEYYVPRYGWLTADPTQNTREAPPTLAGRLANLLDLSRLNLPFAFFALPALGLALIAAGLLWQRRENKNPDHRENERQIIEAAYAHALRLLRRRVPHAPHLAPGEYESRVMDSDVPSAAKQEFAALTHLYLSARYGPNPEANSTDVAACLSRLKVALKRGARD